MADDYTGQTWLPGASGATPMSPSRFQHVEDGLVATSVTANDAAEAVASLQNSRSVGYTWGTVFPAPTLGAPLFWHTDDLKLYVPGGDGWYETDGTPAAADVDGASNAPTNFSAVVNVDNSVSTAWTLPTPPGVTTITAVTVREKFKSPTGVSGMPLAGNATSSLRPTSSLVTTREYYVTCTFSDGTESAESNHVTVYLPYGTVPATGGGTTDPGGAGTSNEIMDLGTGFIAYLGIGLRGSSMFNVQYPELLTNYEKAGYYEMNAAGDGLVFKSWMDGGKTENSSYSRVETREMKGSTGAEKAAWVIGSGKTHVFEYTFAVNHIQPRKPWVTIGQVHDAASDFLAIKMKGDSGGPIGKGDRTSLDLRLVIDDADHATKLLTGYDATQGDSAAQVTVKLEITGTQLKVYCNSVLKITTTISGRTGCYWKAGAYPQSHSTKGDGESPSEYCQITYYAHDVAHTPAI